jgi:hypothetical protein
MRRLSLALLSLALLAAPGVALAHGDAEAGELSIVIGMIGEPVVVGQKSGIEVGLTRADGDPVEGATLTATVSIEGATERFELEPAYGRPGWYKVDFIPTVPGAYTVALSGEAGGETIALEMTAGPETFSVVRPAGEVAFPVALPDPNATAAAAKQAADSAGLALVLAIVAIALAIGGSFRRKG